MKVNKETAAKHRAAIVAEASSLFRERGFDGVGVAEIMQAAGLTHGGFYGHFASKDALAAEASAKAFADGAARVAKDKDLNAYLSRYLTDRHRDASGSGCPMAALAAEIERREAPVQAEFTAGIKDYVAAIEALLQRSGGGKPAEIRRRALVLTAAVVGGMTLARASAATDPGFSGDILNALRAELPDLAGD